MERRAFAWLCPSAADTTYSMLLRPVATARRAPLGEATSADHSIPGMVCTNAATSSASAIAGTARCETNAVASIRRTPVATRARSSRIFASVGIGASICSPSRGPTSRISTRSGSRARSVIVVPFIAASTVRLSDLVRSGRSFHGNRRTRRRKRDG